MVRNLDEILQSVRSVIGDNSSDEAIALIEDITDTLNDTTDWKKKFEENDSEWRKKYRDRFFDPVVIKGKNEVEVVEETDYNKLFEERND